jgi:carboxyl-terminal processing protease
MYSIDASYMIDGETGYIKLSRFSMTSLNEYFDAMTKLQKQGLKNLILDLCGNGGGYLKVAVDLADQFINGKKMLVYTEGLQNPRRNYYSSGSGKFQEGKLIVMIDELSASASEIVAGALQDLDRAVIIGRRSFGKGLVQQPFPLSDGSMIRLTVAKYYTPTGRLIQKPYTEGFDAYSKDLINRDNKGELYTYDPISFPDSLKFNTLSLNRIVYGGGGIMPDYIVPMDTSYLSEYYKTLIRKGVFNQFVLNYEDKNRKDLSSRYPSFSKFDSEFKVSNEVMQQLIKYGEKEGIKFNKEEYDKSKNQLSLLIKAYIARDLWSTTEFHLIYNQKEPVYLKSVEVMKNADLYSKKLQTYHGK